MESHLSSFAQQAKEARDKIESNSSILGSLHIGRKKSVSESKESEKLAAIQEYIEARDKLDEKAKNKEKISLDKIKKCEDKLEKLIELQVAEFKRSDIPSLTRVPRFVDQTFSRVDEQKFLIQARINESFIQREGKWEVQISKLENIRAELDQKISLDQVQKFEAQLGNVKQCLEIYKTHKLGKRVISSEMITFYEGLLIKYKTALKPQDVQSPKPKSVDDEERRTERRRQRDKRRENVRRRQESQVNEEGSLGKDKARSVSESSVDREQKALEWANEFNKSIPKKPSVLKIESTSSSSVSDEKDDVEDSQIDRLQTQAIKSDQPLVRLPEDEEADSIDSLKKDDSCCCDCFGLFAGSKAKSERQIAKQAPQANMRTPLLGSQKGSA